MSFIIVGLGGLLGAMARFGVFQFFKNFGPSFPFATLFVNVLGSLAMGVFAAISHRQGLHESNAAYFLSFGFLGSFTTFSAFSYESLQLFQNQQMTLAILNMASNLLLCLTAVAAGWFFMTKWVF